MKTIFIVLLLIIGLFASSDMEKKLKQNLIQEINKLNQKLIEKEGDNVRLHNKLVDQEIYYDYTIRKQKEFDKEFKKYENKIFEFEEKEKHYPKILGERRNKIAEYEEIIKKRQAKIDLFPEFEAQKNQKIQELQKQLAEKEATNENELEQQKSIWKSKFKEKDEELKKLKEQENQLKLELENVIASKIDFANKLKIFREEEEKRKEQIQKNATQEENMPIIQNQEEENILKTEENFEQQSNLNDTQLDTDSEYYTPQKLDQQSDLNDTQLDTDSEYYTPQKLDYEKVTIPTPEKNKFLKVNQKKKKIMEKQNDCSS